MTGSSSGLFGDLLLGAAAGAAGVWAMDRLDGYLYRGGLDDARTRRATDAARPGQMDPAHVAAQRVARAAGAAPPTPARNNTAGQVIHYSLGIGPGAIYAALRGRVPLVDAGRGTLFGIGLFATQDELGNYAMKLSGPPGRYPWTAHLRGLLAHAVYGAVTDTVLRVVAPRR